jgi:hypothetical protein
MIEPSVLSWSVVIFIYLTAWLFGEQGDMDDDE